MTDTPTLIGLATLAAQVIASFIIARRASIRRRWCDPKCFEHGKGQPCCKDRVWPPVK